MLTIVVLTTDVWIQVHQWTPLLWALDGEGNAATIRLLVEKGANVDYDGSQVRH
jgi:hypothetical protein